MSNPEEVILGNGREVEAPIVLHTHINGQVEDR